MDKQTHDLLKDNYIKLLNEYCKFKDKLKISNSKSCEDMFNDKILYFIEADIKNPTLNILKEFLHTKRDKIKYINYIEYNDNYEIEVSEEIKFKEQLDKLFIDFRKK